MPIGILAVLMGIFIIYKIFRGVSDHVGEVLKRRISNTDSHAAIVVPVDEPAGAHIFFWESCDKNNFFSEITTREESVGITKRFENTGRVVVDEKGKGVIRLQPQNVYGDEWVLVHYRVNLGPVKTLSVNVKTKVAHLHVELPCQELKTHGLSIKGC
jgi:hypothetical protein